MRLDAGDFPSEPGQHSPDLAVVHRLFEGYSPPPEHWGSSSASDWIVLQKGLEHPKGREQSRSSSFAYRMRFLRWHYYPAGSSGLQYHIQFSMYQGKFTSGRPLTTKPMRIVHWLPLSNLCAGESRTPIDFYQSVQGLFNDIRPRGHSQVSCHHSLYETHRCLHGATECKMHQTRDSGTYEMSSSSSFRLERMSLKAFGNYFSRRR